jgi:hypothetical protein
MNTSSLAQYFNFDESDLYANRNGRLSEKQTARLVQESKSSKLPSVGCGLGFFVIASIFPFAFFPLLTSGYLGVGGSLGVLAAVLFWVIVWATIGVFIIRSGFKAPNLTLDQVEGAVNIIGVQRRSSSSSSYYTAYELHIGNRQFNVDGALGGLLMQGDRYAIYFLKDSNRIMSIERLG